MLITLEIYNIFFFINTKKAFNVCHFRYFLCLIKVQRHKKNVKLMFIIFEQTWINN